MSAAALKQRLDLEARRQRPDALEKKNDRAARLRSSACQVLANVDMEPSESQNDSTSTATHKSKLDSHCTDTSRSLPSCRSHSLAEILPERPVSCNAVASGNGCSRVELPRPCLREVSATYIKLASSLEKRTHLEIESDASAVACHSNANPTGSANISLCF